MPMQFTHTNIVGALWDLKYGNISDESTTYYNILDTYTELDVKL